MTANEIPEEFIEKVWTDIGNIESKSKVDLLSQSFFKKQEALAEYILGMSDDLSEEAQALAFYLGIVVWTCYDKYSKGTLKKIDHKVVLKTHEKIEAQIGKLEKVDDRFIERRILSKSDYSQPFILKYIVEALFERHEHESLISTDEEGMIFIILSVHMTCLDQAIQKKLERK